MRLRTDSGASGETSRTARGGGSSGDISGTLRDAPSASSFSHLGSLRPLMPSRSFLEECAKVSTVWMLASVSFFTSAAEMPFWPCEVSRGGVVSCGRKMQRRSDAGERVWTPAQAGDGGKTSARTSSVLIGVPIVEIPSSSMAPPASSCWYSCSSIIAGLHACGHSCGRRPTRSHI